MGTAYVSKDGVHTIIINITAKENSIKSGLIGTISEEGSHIINGAKGRQIETGTEEKGLESTGRATNSYFQDKYKDDKTTISMKSDGAIDTSKLGTHVGDKIIMDQKDIEYLQELVDYKLGVKNCSGKNKDKKCTVYIINKGNQQIHNHGNQLVENLISKKEKINITFDPNQVSSSNQIKYEGKTSYNINIDKNQNPESWVWDYNKNEIYLETIPISIILGHELIHAQHFLENTNSQINNAENYFFDKRFNSVQNDTNGEIGSQEEYKTVGIGFTKEEAEKQEKFGLRNDDGSIRVTGKYNNPGDITENMLRLELGLPLRLNYYRRIYIEQKSNIKK